ncbi:MAG: hypothetical protein PHD76_13155 [Methylacidiphilales bacterium]|nr:hypothetical protein [Candidatus Methylacidiphilales bacterium]
MELQESRAIIFEGVNLPNGVYWLELLTYIIPNLSEASRDWTLDLHYSLGKERSETSEHILKYVLELKNALDQNEAAVISELTKRLPNLPTHQIIKDWRSGMALMETIAKGSKSCRWSIIATESEMQKAGDLLIAFLERFAVEHDLIGGELHEFEKLKERIATSSAENKHEMLNAALESLSNRNR